MLGEQDYDKASVGWDTGYVNIPAGTINFIVPRWYQMYLEYVRRVGEPIIPKTSIYTVAELLRTWDERI